MVYEELAVDARHGVKEVLATTRKESAFSFLNLRFRA